ncbi:MAG: type II toxin-antitoxin system RelE/ParE family toxin [Rickettsiales bacterium]
MPEIVWLTEALEDTERLFSFLRDKNSQAAINLAQALQGGTKLLADFPEVGRPMDDNTKRRELFIPFGQNGYVLRYILDLEFVVIIRVWHCRENRDYLEQ